jgi:uracil-DNA glycosylase
VQTKISAFIESLVDLGQPPLCFNPYASGDAKRDAIRRENLRLYLTSMAELEPSVLLVGEAPGYNGCHWTGLPFTSERQLSRGVQNHTIFGAGKGYHWTSGRPEGYTEPSGTILWGVLAELAELPLLWNAFPFHPFKEGKPLSNRTPTSTELASHAFILQSLAELFSIQRYIALGRKAQDVLGQLGIEADRVRHPANGGKNACREGLLTLLGDRGSCRV